MTRPGSLKHRQAELSGKGLMAQMPTFVWQAVL
jgi:hypothetical protein